MKSKAIRILEDLVRIQSVNPAFPGDARGERDVADYVAAYCERLGMKVRRQEVLPGRKT